MNATLAFDVYGTLVDPLGIAIALRAHLGDAAGAFAQLWREKQLEYTFRRALMRDYRDFPTCTRQALEFADAKFGSRLAPEVRETLLATYRALPAYPDAIAGLSDLKALGHRCYAFSNGHPADLERLLEHAGLDRYLAGIVSVHPTASFKPDPVVYRHFVDSVKSEPDGTWLVSGNPFDVLGAHAAGWKTAWVRRDAGALFDPWGVAPSVAIGNLLELPGALGPVTEDD
jgi:2-haloacid dehalogenase